MFSSDLLPVTGTNETQNCSEPLDAVAYRLGNLLSLPNAGKWRGKAFSGMVVDRSTLEHPGVELKRLLNLGAIFPATADELAAYERTYGEPQQTIKNRESQLTELRRKLDERVRASRRDSTRVKLLNDLIREWSDIENQCRMCWSGEFGVLMGKSEEQVRRYWIHKESDLRTMAGKEDIYREAIAEVAEPILIAAAGMSVDIAPLHDFLASMAHQWNGRNPKEWQVQEWLPPMQYKLLHREKQVTPIFRRVLATLWEQSWKLVLAVLTAAAILVATGLIVIYFRSRGINLK